MIYKKKKHTLLEDKKMYHFNDLRKIKTCKSTNFDLLCGGRLHESVETYS